jgi:hypothetical protein
VNWCTELSGVPPDSVRCTRPVQGWTNHSRENTGALCYNSPGCPVCHQTIPCASGATANSCQRSTLTDAQCSTVPRQKSEQRVRGAPDCLVHHQIVRCHKKTKVPTVNCSRTLTVGWRCGALDCLVRPSPAAFPTAILVVEGYKYPSTTTTSSIQVFWRSHSIQEL